MVYRMADGTERITETEVVEKIEVEGGDITITKEPIQEEPIPEIHYCDLIISCKCGEVKKIGKGIEGGLQLVIVPREDSYILLHCDKCNSELKLHLVDGEKPEEGDNKIIELLTDEETAKKIAENPNVEVLESTTIENEDVSQENKSEESL
jgi:hypothetical protein